MAELVVAFVRCTDLRVDVDPLTGAVSRDARAAALSASDAAAVEHALRFANAWDARVLVVTAGGPECDSALREIRALGAEVRRVELFASYMDELVADEQHLAKLLVASLGEDRPDLVLCADRSADRGTGALPAFLAHELGAAQAPGLVSLELVNGDVIAERRLDFGRRERMRVPLPAVCSVEAAGVRLRRASLQSSLDAALHTVPVVSVPALRSRVRVVRSRPLRPRPRHIAAPTGTPRERLLALTGALLSHDPATIVGPVDAPGAVDALLEFLVRNGYLSEERTGWAAS